MSERRQPPPVPPGSLHVVGAAILAGRHCFVALRSETMSTPLRWELPGGKVTPGEAPKEALRREIVEELALEIDVGSWIGRGFSWFEGRRVVLDVYRARNRGGEPRLLEHREGRWVTGPEMASLEWAPADVEIWPRVAEIMEAMPPEGGSAEGPRSAPERQSHR